MTEKFEAMIGQVHAVHITQKVSIAEAATFGCCEMENVYVGRIGDKDGEKIFTAKENSGCFERCFCAPLNSLLLEISDPEDNVIYTLERPGCCFAKPCLGVVPCMDMCVEEMTLHDGHKSGDPGSLDDPAPVFKVKQSTACEAMCAPELKVIYEGVETPSMTITGPQCFGGCSELCCDSKFEAVNKSGDPAGEVKKLAPRDCSSVCAEMFTDSDKYLVTFGEDNSADDKAALLTSAFLVDFMYFEADQGMLNCRNGNCSATCCLCYCMGCTIPWNCYCPGSKGEEEK